MTQSQTGRLLLVLIALASILVSNRRIVIAQDSGEDGRSTDELALKQSHLADKYQQLEMLMLKMAEFDSTSNPRRSALLKRALAQSKEQHIRLQLDQLVRLLQEQQLASAVDDQGQVQKDLQSLLELLLSESEHGLGNLVTQILPGPPDSVSFLTNFSGTPRQVSGPERRHPRYKNSGTEEPQTATESRTRADPSPAGPNSSGQAREFSPLHPNLEHRILRTRDSKRRISDRMSMMRGIRVRTL